jgi:hypothetical protein
MTTGFNTEFKFNDRVFHVQTEDKGLTNPKIQTLIYVRGEILDSLQDDYSDLLNNQAVSESDIALRMEAQHKHVVNDIKSGKFESMPISRALYEDSLFNDRPLDEVILEYLQKGGATETLELIPDGPFSPTFGSLFEFAMTARLCNSKFPVPEAKISVKFISNFQKTVELIAGKTDLHGKFSFSINLPPIQPGHCEILLSCVSEHGNDEIRTFISA